MKNKKGEINVTPKRYREIEMGWQPGQRPTEAELDEYFAMMPPDELAEHIREQAESERVNAFRIKFAASMPPHRAPGMNSGIGNSNGW